MRRITKRFGELSANNNIDFKLKKGEIHALLGENGAGKTTLMNILSGMYHPDGGEIFVTGKKVRIHSPHESLMLGIGMVYQHLTLVPTLSVLEDIFLGTTSKFLLPRKFAEEKVRDISEKYGLHMDPHTKIWQLSAGEQERVEILKLFYRGSNVLILDEPTSVLTSIEVGDFFKVLKGMAKAGKSVVFITHKIDEELSISDRITILKRGENGGEIDMRNVDVGKEGEHLKEKIVTMMFREAKFLESREDDTRECSERVVLSLEGVTARNDRGVDALKQISFSIHDGEVLGIAGVDGNGQKELAEVIAGLRTVTGGTITLNQSNITNEPVRSINEKGLFYVTEDRIEEGSVGDFSLAENAIFRCYRKEPFSKRGILLNMDEINCFCGGLIESFSIKAPGADVPVRTLSGGNIQKLILAREFSHNPLVLVCNKPTHGLDVFTTQSIRNEIWERSRKGVSGLMISSDLDAIIEISDRIGVFFGYLVINLRINQIVAGLGIEILVVGITSLLYRIIFGSEFPVVPDITGKTAIPLLSRVPYITSIFNQHLITYISWVLLPIAWWVLYKTNFGLRVRAVGESPVAADAHGVNVYRTRYMTLIIEGVLAGLAGAFLSICVLARNTRLPGAFCQPYERE